VRSYWDALHYVSTALSVGYARALEQVREPAADGP
jgi:hypothetical protein